MKITLSREANEDGDSREYVLSLLLGCTVDVTTFDGSPGHWGEIVAVADGQLTIQPDDGDSYTVSIQTITEVQYL